VRRSFMALFRFFPLVVFFMLLAACISTTGEIKENRFIDQDFSVGLLNDEWQVTRQKVNHMVQPNAFVQRENTPWALSFSHTKSNGFIGVGAYDLNELGLARSLEVWADNLVSNSGGLKLSDRSIKIDGSDALELVVSGKYMVKWIIMKKGKKAYRMVYSNSPTYFDQSLAVFDGFVETFRFQQ
jgi:hypothetical protein